MYTAMYIYVLWNEFLFWDKEQMYSHLKVVAGKNQSDYGIPTTSGLQANKWTSNFPFPKQLQIVKEEITKNHLGIIRLIFWLFVLL